MPNLIISTCGTSVLTNHADRGMRDLLQNYANAKEKDIKSEHISEIQAWIESQRCKFLEACDEDAARQSAEINSLRAYYLSIGAHANARARDRHYLVRTDTYLGEQAASCVSDYLQNKWKCYREEVWAPGLNTSDINDFQAALSDIAKNIGHILLLSGYRVGFNLTGGFKAINGFMQTLGMLYADECFYIFERSQKLMRVPRLPISLNAAGAFEENLQSVRKMWNGKPTTISECPDIAETLVMKVGHDVTLSDWGEILWDVERPKFYGKKLMPSLSDRLKFGNVFVRQGREGKGVLKDTRRMSELNCCLDGLGKHLQDGHGVGHFTTPDNRTLKFKKLAGSPMRGTTHEFYIWNDLSHRGFGSFKGCVFVVDKFGPHL